MYDFLYQNRSVILHVEGLRDLGQIFTTLQVNFPDLFQKIEGMRTISYREKTTLITFVKDGNHRDRSIYCEEFHKLCKDGQKVKFNTFEIGLKTTLPPEPDDIITLYPYPFEMEDFHFKQAIAKTYWGQLNRIQYGKLRNSNIKNGFVNLYIKDANMDIIPPRIKILGHWINVTKPHEAGLPMCNYCKARGHTTPYCPKIAEKKCTNCKEKGHDAQFCPHKQRYNLENPWNQQLPKQKTPQSTKKMEGLIPIQNRYAQLEQLDDPWPQMTTEEDNTNTPKTHFRNNRAKRKL